MFGRIGLRLVHALTLALICCVVASAEGAVVVLANRTTATVRCIVSEPGQADRELSLQRGAVLPVTIGQRTQVAYYSGRRDQRFSLAADTIYIFDTRDNELSLQRVALAPTVPLPTANSAAATMPATTAANASIAGRPETLGADLASKSNPVPAETASSKPREPLKIPIKILVDDDEQATRRNWESRLTKRIEAISDILELHCGVRLNVVASDTWITDNAVNDFERTVDEFVQKVDPQPARVAIGFTSQYQVPQGKFNLGGTRGALQKHILIREWSQHITEEERLEVVLHEVGHFLGAAHSPDRDSVMRPVLGDRQARARDFRIGFDPLNTLALNLIAEEMRSKPLPALSELSLATRVKLSQVYAALAKGLPNDPAPPQYFNLLKLPLPRTQPDELKINIVPRRPARDVP